MKRYLCLSEGYSYCYTTSFDNIDNIVVLHDVLDHKYNLNHRPT